MQYDAPLVDVLSLVSLAAEERVRGVVEQAAALARSRRVNSHGVVGETWRGMAKNATDRDGQGRGQGAEVAAKLESKERDEPYNAITEKSRKLIDADARTERDRAAKRAKRSTDAAIKAESRAGSVGPEGANGGANGEAAGAGAQGDRAATSGGADEPKKMSKKSLKKAESKVSEAVQHQQA
ncbi:hypothetical protein KEM55_001647, partial [Ascosphaera atra]